jgi:GT2 family glycosyltransferase
MNLAATVFPDVDAIIVAHDSGTLLECAVGSVESQVAPGRVLVVDSGSTDGAADSVAAAHPDVRVVRIENRGFATAVNAGIASTSGEFVLLLNPDAMLEERCVDPLASRAKANRKAGIVAPLVTDPDGRTQDGSFGPFPALLHVVATRVNRLVHRFGRGKDARPWLEIHGTTPVDWVTGACMLVRRSAIKAVGPMDEGFFLYYEDVEWCHRMHDGGWAVLIEPTSICVHARGGSGGGATRDTRKEYRKSFYRYCKLYRLHGLAFAARIGLTGRQAADGHG